VRGHPDIDKNIQYIVERELKKAVQASSARGGMAVVLDPKTGEILALAAQPSYDRTIRLPIRPMCERTDDYRYLRAGSTFKTFLVSAALEERVVGPADVFFCENGPTRWGGGWP